MPQNTMKNNPSWDPDDFISALKQLKESIPDESKVDINLSKHRLSSLRKKIGSIIAHLQMLRLRLDPIQQPKYILDPSDPGVMGELIAKTFLTQPIYNLAGLDRFYGSGVYALYYKGSFSAYKPISGTDVPIYVGKVDPKLPSATTAEEQGDKIWCRLMHDHVNNSISRAVSTLKVADFRCRFLVVKSAWQSTAELYLIDWFKPIWNKETGICYGIGKHGDSASTRANTRSPWDELHPGRDFAIDSEPFPGGAEEIKRRIKSHYKKHFPSNQLSKLSL